VRQVEMMMLSTQTRLLLVPVGHRVPQPGKRHDGMIEISACDEQVDVGGTAGRRMSVEPLGKGCALQDHRADSGCDEDRVDPAEHGELRGVIEIARDFARGEVTGDPLAELDM
jgi:hypothetical protein